HATVDAIPLDIAHHFAALPDPRHPAFGDRHALTDILVISLTAVLCGAKSWEAIAAFGTAKLAWFRTIGLQLRNGIPSHDTFSRAVSFDLATRLYARPLCYSATSEMPGTSGQCCRLPLAKSKDTAGTGNELEALDNGEPLISVVEKQWQRTH